MTGESSPSLRTLVKIRVKQLNVWPMLMLLIIVLALVYWFGSIR
jgi:predicted RND superfamily exporter protein